MATMMTGEYAALTAPGIEMWMEEEAKLHKPMYTKIFDLKTTSRLYEDDSSISGVGFLEEVGEAAAAPEDEDLLGYMWRYEQKVFKLKKSVSRLLSDTDLYDKMKTSSKDLARKAVLSRDLRAFELFRRAADPAKIYGDGKPLLSVAHPRKDGGAAQRNTFLGGVQKPLGYDSLKELQDVCIEIVANNGMPLDIGLHGKMVLMVTPYNRDVALQITDAEGTPGTADHSVNYWKGRSLDVMEVPYISWRYAYANGETTSTDREAYDERYFLLDSYYAKQVLKFKQLQDFDTKAWEDEDTDVWYAKVRDVFAVGISGWFGIVGSLGDGTTLTN